MNASNEYLYSHLVTIRVCVYGNMCFYFGRNIAFDMSRHSCMMPSRSSILPADWLSGCRNGFHSACYKG